MERAMRLFGETVHDLRNPLLLFLDIPTCSRTLRPIRTGARSGRTNFRRTAKGRCANAGHHLGNDVCSPLTNERLPLNPELRPADFCELLLTDREPDGRVQLHCGDGLFPSLPMARASVMRWKTCSPMD